MPEVDKEQIARLFDEDRDPQELVREDDWHASPEIAHLYLYDTAAALVPEARSDGAGVMGRQVGG